MPLQIQVLIKCVYGTDMLYPVSKEAKALAEIAGKRTLSVGDLRIARDKMGAELVLLNCTAGVAKLVGEPFKVAVGYLEPVEA